MEWLQKSRTSPMARPLYLPTHRKARPEASQMKVPGGAPGAGLLHQLVHMGLGIGW